MVDPMNDLDLEVGAITEIADFLAKPMPVASGAFTTTNVAGDLLYSSDIFNLFNAQSIWVNKIQGFLNMRGTVKLRLVINPTPFQAGLLKLSYFPCANQLGNEANARLTNRVCISQLPGAYLNLMNNFVEVSVPYIAPTTFIERDRVAANDFVSWGNLYLHVFEPLRTGTGPTSINYTIWMSVEDLELSGMVQPQMAKRQGKRLDSEANSGKGPIAKIMSSGVQLLNDVGAIPSLAPIAKPASWVVSALQGLAENFGWSKPTISEGPCLQTVNQNWFAVNTRGNDNSAPLSLDPDNKVMPITDASPSNMDEMSVNFIKRRWAQFADITWTTASTSGALISNISLYPGRFKATNSIGGINYYSAAPCAVFSELYSQYRGSFEIRLRIVKTGFHTGTLAVGFVPGKNATTPSYSDSAYVYRQIIDIQDGSDFVFNCPYMIPQDFLETNKVIGNFFIYVVNPLIAPATVSSSVDIMFEVRGGPDLQYTKPISCAMTPFVPQGVDNVTDEEATTITLGSANHTMGALHHAVSSVGDCQLSVLELIKAVSTVNYASSATTLDNGLNFAYWGANKTYASRWNGVALTSGEIGGDLLSFIGSWYVLSRGSQRYRVIPINPSTLDQDYRAYLVNYGDPGWNQGYGHTWITAASGSLDQDGVTQTVTSTNTTLGPGSGLTGRLYQSPQINSGVAVQVPFYHLFRYALNHWVTSFGDKLDSFAPNNGVCFYTPGATKSTLERSAGDDFMFSYFCGIPPYTDSYQFYKKYT